MLCRVGSYQNPACQGAAKCSAPSLTEAEAKARSPALNNPGACFCCDDIAADELPFSPGTFLSVPIPNETVLYTTRGRKK